MEADPHDLVVRTVREHASALLRTARRHSLCADDAHDAYQRALEIFLRRAATVEPETAVRWLHVVVKHEAQAVRRSRQQLVGAEEADLDARVADTHPDPDERALRFDRLSRSAEALARLKPQEVRALWLKAQGHSYREIAEREGWTYTKVNRCITEGRRAFLDRYAGIEAGEECERWAPVVSAMVDGEATAEQLAAARPHLRRCAGCRATVRELQMAGPRLAGVLPVMGLVGGGVGSAGAPGPLDALARTVEGVVVAIHERASAWALKLQMAGEAASATKVAAVAASAAAIAGGGAVTAHQAVRAQHRPGVERRAVRAAARAPVSAAAAAPAAPAVAGPSGLSGAGPGSEGASSPPRPRGSEFGIEGGAAGSPGQEFSARDPAVETRPPAAHAAAREPAAGVVERPMPVEPRRSSPRPDVEAPASIERSAPPHPGAASEFGVE